MNFSISTARSSGEGIERWIFNVDYPSHKKPPVFERPAQGCGPEKKQRHASPLRALAAKSKAITNSPARTGFSFRERANESPERVPTLYPIEPMRFDT
jgi:hypothetical protein